MTYRTGWSLGLLAVTLLGLGWCVGGWRARNMDAEMRHRLQQRAVHIARSLNLEMVKGLSFSAADQHSPAFQFICKQMTALGKYIPQRGIYSMTLREGRLLFGPESYPADDPMSSPPGLIYEAPAPEVFECFAQGKAITVGPYADEYGTFVSAFAPVIDPRSGAVLMVVAIDTLADDWQTTLGAAGREPILGSLILLGVLLAGVGVTAWRKRHRTPDGLSPGKPVPGRPDGCERVPPAGRYVNAGLLVGLGVLAVVFLGVVLLQTWCWTYDRIDQAASQQARLAVEFDKALRDYVGKHVRPEMEKRVEPGGFIREAMSTSFVARSVFDDVCKLFPDTVLRFASTNPRNPVNRATPSEESLIRYFEQHPEADAWSGTMEFFEQGEKYIVCAAPRRFETSCLQCHGRPEKAPASLLERYGPVAGFGRSVGEVSVDLAAIPVSASYVAARAQISRHMLIALGLCLVFLAGIAFLIGADARRRRRAEIAVEKERSLLRLVIDTMPGFVGVKSEEGRYVIANEALAKAYGSTVPAVEGRSDGDFSLSPEQADRYRRDDLEVITSKKTKVIAQEPITYADGTTHWLTTTKVPLIGEEGRCHQLLVVSTDITQRKEAQEALRRERDRAQRYLDIADVMLLALNEKGQITLINREGNRLLGYEEQELLGKDWIETCLPPQTQPTVREYFRLLLAGEVDSVKYTENPICTRSGAERILAWHNTVVKDDTGKIVGTLSSGEDITERQQIEEALRESEERLRRTLDAAQTVAWEGDLRSDALIETGPVAALFGQPEGVVCTDRFAFLERIHPEDRQRVAATMQSGASGGDTYEIEYRICLPDGGVRWIQATGRFDRDADGRPGRLRGIARDITEQKHAERQQTILLQQLDGINQELKDFAYIVSHDLKAPLRAIRNLADWLCADYQDKLDEQGKENLRLLSGRVDRMHNLIDGVLQYSRIGRTEQTTVAVDLCRLLPEIIDALGAPEHITIRVESDLPTIEADATRITQVFQNLLSNAIKYMDKPQGLITVDCVPDNDFWKFSVADNGPGIDRKDYERIFKLFQTLTRRDDSESTGVGLTVAKKIVEVYGGRIWVESEVGQGSTFFFTFPQAQAHVPDETLQTCGADV